MFFRIALGLSLLWNVIYYKWLELKSLFLPSNSLFGNLFIETIRIPSNLWSPFNYIIHDWIFLIILSVYTLCILLLIIGKGLPYVQIFIVVFWWSFQQRFSLVSYGWDDYFMAILTLSLFLPLTANKIKEARSNSSNEIVGPFIFLMIAQIACIYLFSALSKTGTTWHQGIAAYFLLTDMMKNNSLACFISSKMFFIQVFTYGTLIIEYVIPLLIIFPIFNKKTRLIAALLIVSFHFGISLFTQVGHFKYVALSVSILLVPGFVWDKFKIKPYQTNGNSSSTNFSLIQFIVAFVFMVGILTQNIALKINDQGNIFNLKEKSSIFQQNWSLYAPNPSVETGKVEIVISNDENEKSVYSNISKSRLVSHFLAMYRLQKEKDAGKVVLQLHANWLLNNDNNYEK